VKRVAYVEVDDEKALLRLQLAPGSLAVIAVAVRVGGGEAPPGSRQADSRNSSGGDWVAGSLYGEP
jgi:hypothetical protein